MPIHVDLDHRPVTSKTRHCALLQGNPCLLPCEVVAIWGVLLGLLAAVNAGFGNNAVVLAMAASAAGGMLLLAGAVWLHWRLRRRRHRWLRQPTRIGAGVLLPAAITLAWLSLAFGGWLLPIAAAAVVPAAGLEISARRKARALSAGALSAGALTAGALTLPAPRLSAETARRPQQPVTAAPAEPWAGEWEQDSRERKPALSGASR
jgi:hypothetical protein